MNAKQNTGLKRLLVLAKFLRKLPRKRFDYGSVVSNWSGGKQDLSCGASACAMGWAATMPVFRKLGLYLNVKSHDACTKAGSNYYITSAEEIFNIGEDEAEYLFTPHEGIGPGYNATPKQVAAHIENFVARKLKEESTNA